MEEELDDVSFLVGLKEKDEELTDKKNKGEVKVCSIDNPDCENCGS
jgi:hypothetical protein